MLSPVRTLLLVALVLPGAILASERDFVARVHRTDRGDTMPYRLLIPENYDRRRAYPLVIWLHGGGRLSTLLVSHFFA